MSEKRGKLGFSCFIYFHEYIIFFTNSLVNIIVYYVTKNEFGADFRREGVVLSFEKMAQNIGPIR